MNNYEKTFKLAVKKFTYTQYFTYKIMLSVSVFTLSGYNAKVCFNVKTII